MGQPARSRPASPRARGPRLMLGIRARSARMRLHCGFLGQVVRDLALLLVLPVKLAVRAAAAVGCRCMLALRAAAAADCPCMLALCAAAGAGCPFVHALRAVSGAGFPWKLPAPAHACLHCAAAGAAADSSIKVAMHAAAASDRPGKVALRVAAAAGCPCMLALHAAATAGCPGWPALATIFM